MNLTELCPSCLDELPADYPHDHVAIDLALTCHRDRARPRFRSLSRADRGELVRVALARGWTINALYLPYGRSVAGLRALAAATNGRLAAA